MASTLVHLPQLTSSSNFNNWKFRVRVLLEEKQISETLEKTIDEFSNETLKNDFLLKDSKAKCIIVQCLTDKHLDMVKDAKTSKDMMKALQDVFERRSVFTKLTLKKKLLMLKHKRNEKLEDHFLNFDTLLRDLESVGAKMEEEDKVCHLLLSLNDEFGSVITAIETMSSTSVSMDFVKSRLLDEELKIKSKSRPNNENSEVSFTAGPYTCFKCGKKGHKIAECRNQLRGNFRGRRGYSRGTYNNRGQGSISNGNHNQANKADEVSFITNRPIESRRDLTKFILDSGCTQHMVMEELEQYMTEIKQLKLEVRIGTAKDNQILYARKQGIIRGICQGKEIKIDALIVEGMSHNLISVSKLLKNNFQVTFSNDKQGNKQAILSKSNVIFNCKSINDLFFLKVNFDVKKSNCTVTNNNYDFNYLTGETTDKDIWHRRLGHLNRQGLRQLGLPFNNDICSTCVEGKSTRKPFRTCIKKTMKIGELIHSDIAGPIATPTSEGHKYFQVLIDDYSHFLIVKLLKHKNEAEQNLIDFIKLIKTQHGLKTKRVRVDNGGEFVSGYFGVFCRDKGIELEYTLPYTPQENGKAERMNRTLLDKVRTKFSETNLPRKLWGEAVLCSAYELNRSPTQANNGETPAQRWYKKNDLSKLRIFGSQAWAVILPRQSKLEKRAQPCIMIGYMKAGYRLWNYQKDEVICSRDVRFNEKCTNFDEITKGMEDYKEEKIISIQNFTEKSENGEDKVEENNRDDSTGISSESSEESIPEINETRRGRKINPPKHLNEYEIYTAYCLISKQNIDTLEYEDAMKDELWKKAIEKELDSHRKLNTWTEAKLPQENKAIQTKWIFRIKEDGTRKARVVAKGYQMKEVNYFEPTYSPVARLSTIRLLLSIALKKDWKTRQLDIPTAFLNGKLESEVYIYAPAGVETKSHILKLNRALYGLKESPKVWNDTFNNFATKNNFKRSRHDCCLYCGDNVWIVLYVDDIIVVGKEQCVQETEKLLKQYFQAKDLGEVENFLGMKILRTENIIKINQTKYIEKLLTTFNMEQCKPKKTPMEKTFQYNDKNEILDNVPYRQLIGGLMYLSTSTRPDITFSVSYLSRFLDRPTLETWNAGKRILRYLQGTKDIGLTFYKDTENDSKLEGYSDADWRTDKNDRKSVSGCITLYDGDPIQWFSKKQSCVALSTAEAEYVAAATCAQDLINLKGILNDLKLNNDTILYCDNKSSILMSKSNENSKRAKHIDIKYHYLKDLVSRKELDVKYISTEENLADMLTKPLSKEIFVELRNKVNIS